MKRSVLLLALLFAALPAFAQTTVVSGTVKDANGIPYVGAQIRAQLVLAGAGVSGQPVVTVNDAQQCRSSGFGSAPCKVPFTATVGPVGLDSTASFTLSLQDNSLVTPASTQWKIDVNTIGAPPPLGTGPQTCSATVTITGASQSLTSTFSACPALSAVIGGSSPSSIPGTPGVTTVPITSGLLVENRHLVGENPCAAVDYSGNGNNATGCNGTAPTNIAVTGGTQFNGNGNFQWPTGITSAGRSFAFYACFQNPASSTANNFLFISSATPTGFGVTTNFPAINTLFGGSRLFTLANNAVASQTNFPFNGCGTVGVSQGATDHIYWNGQETTFYNGTGTSAGVGTGTLLVGGNSGNFWQGPVCWDDVWNRAIAQSEHLAVANFLNVICPNRGFTAPFAGLTNAGDMIDTTGDSIIGDFALTTRWQSQVVLNPALAWNTITEPMTNNGLPGKSLGQMAADVNYEVWPMLRGAGVANGVGGRNTVVAWGGTNDCAASATAATIEQRLAKFSSFLKEYPNGAPKLIFATMLSRTGVDACKNSWNTLERLNAPLYVDYNVDIADDPLVGADGAFAVSAWFQADGIHWTQAAATNMGAFYFQRALNALWGPQGFSSANTYTATSTAATAITSTSSSGSISTINMAANPWVAGMSCVVAGAAVGGYNSPAGHGWFILTANATSVTFQNTVSGLGAGGAAGTIQCAQELDQDTLFENLGGAGTGQSHILQTCMGRDPNLPKLIQVTDTNAAGWGTITSLVGETFNGAATFTVPVVVAATKFPVIRLDKILTSASAAGCSWRVTVQ